ncbi:MAG: S41 family peptidase, partial [Planctomycetota bacterium]|nr:S41 family peptidase [Planctomycetota bacterium]
YEIAAQGKSMLIRKAAALHVVDAAAATVTLDAKNQVNLSGWTFPITPREEWDRMFLEAWRLERDYFWDSNMHGVNWNDMLKRYTPLAARVITRAELNDVIAQMVGELSALHIFVRGGDMRAGDTDIAPASLGGLFSRDTATGGWRIDRIFINDPDEPSRCSPLAAPGVNLAVGDIITHVNGRPAADVADIAVLLRGQTGRQVLLGVKPAAGDAKSVITTPISMASEEDLRYHEWEYTRTKLVDKASDNQIGYMHLRAMGTENFTEFAKGFYPNYQRQGLIIDARHNRGGNIDSWILNRLIRKAWFYWSPDVGSTYWNMQFAFRGHIVVLCNERTASDGEAFAEGIKRLKLGSVIGTRTWGGEIWLSSSNFLVDGGIATAAETGVFGPEGDWLIEGHGVEPDVVVDNLPHATFKGEDAQLNAAIEHLKKKIKEQPVQVPPTPKRPNKSHTER